MTKKNCLVILAGGLSTRMKKQQTAKKSRLSVDEINEANTLPKGMIVLDSKKNTLLDYIILNAIEAGIQEIILVIGENASMIEKKYCAPNNPISPSQASILFAYQKIPEGRVKPSGTSDALLQAIQQHPFLKKQSFLVCNSDNLYSKNAFKSLLKNKVNQALISYDRESLEFSTPKIASFAVLLIKNNSLITIQEKPEPKDLLKFKDETGKIRVSMNIFKFQGEAIYPFLYHCPLHPLRNEKELPTAIRLMIQNPKLKIHCIPLSEHVPDLTQKEDIEILKNWFKKESV